MRTGFRFRTPVGVVSALLSLALSVARPAAGQTDGFVLHCLSARAAGLGCVTRGQEGIPTTLFKDPAGIVAFDRPAFEANVGALVPSISFTNSLNTADGAVHAYPLGSLAFVGPKVHGFSWALGVDPIGGLGSDFRLKNATLGSGSQNYESFFAGAKVGPVLARELAPGFSIGASVSLAYGQIRHFRMPFAMPASAAKGLGGLLQMDPHYATLFAGMSELTAYGDSKAYSGTGVSADLGVSWKVSPALRVAASWSPKTTLALSGGTAVMDMGAQFNTMYQGLVQERMLYHGDTQQQAQLNVATMLGQAGLDLSKGAEATRATYDAAADLALPQTIGIGATLTPAPLWKVALEGGWMQWSKAEHVMPFKLTNSSNPNLNILINGDRNNASFTYPFPLSWKDSWVAKAGVERSLGDAALRGGYAYGSNPVPDNAIFITFPAIVEHSAMLGATLPLGRLPLDVAVIHAFRKELDGDDNQNLISSEYRGSATKLSETTIVLGTVLRF